jgi:hypothetical protein
VMNVDILPHISSFHGKSWMTGKLEKTGKEQVTVTEFVWWDWEEEQE